MITQSTEQLLMSFVLLLSVVGYTSFKKARIRAAQKKNTSLTAGKTPEVP